MVAGEGWSGEAGDRENKERIRLQGLEIVAETCEQGKRVWWLFGSADRGAGGKGNGGWLSRENKEKRLKMGVGLQRRLQPQKCKKFRFFVSFSGGCCRRERGK